MQGYLVITPVKDEAPFIGRMVKSMLRQTLKPVCWVIVDDASRDATPEILAELTSGHEFIRVVRMDSGNAHRKPGGGVMEACNVGIQQATAVESAAVCELDGAIQ